MHQVLKEHGIESTFEFPLGNYTYDLKLAGRNVLIEINPSFTHSMYGKSGPYGHISQNYHQMKTQFAHSRGYDCVHVFSYDSFESIAKTLVEPKATVANSELKVSKIAKHIENDCFGTFYENRLIETLEISNADDKLTIHSMQNIPEVKPQKPFEKILDYLIKSFNVSCVETTVDFSKALNFRYIDLGFELKSLTKPQVYWCRNKKKIPVNLEDVKTSNINDMVENGWFAVPDCGKATYF